MSSFDGFEFSFSSPIRLPVHLGTASLEVNAHMEDMPDLVDPMERDYDETKRSRPPLGPPEPLKVSRVRIDDRGLWKPYRGLSLPQLGRVRIPLQGRAKRVPKTRDRNKKDPCPAEKPFENPFKGLAASKFAMPEGTYYSPPLWMKPTQPTYRTYNCQPVCQRKRIVSDKDRDALDVEADECERRTTRLMLLEGKPIPGSWPDDLGVMEGIEFKPGLTAEEIDDELAGMPRYEPNTIMDNDDTEAERDQITLMSGALNSTAWESDSRTIIPLPPDETVIPQIVAVDGKSPSTPETQELIAVDNKGYTTFFYNNKWLPCARRFNKALPGRRRVGAVAVNCVQGAVELTDSFKRRAVSLFEKTVDAPERRNHTKKPSPRGRSGQRRSSLDSSRPTSKRHYSSSPSSTGYLSSSQSSTATPNRQTSTTVPTSERHYSSSPPTGYFSSLSPTLTATPNHRTSTTETSHPTVPTSERSYSSSPSPSAAPSRFHTSATGKSPSLSTFHRAVQKITITRPISAIAKSLTFKNVSRLGRVVARFTGRYGAKPSGVTKPARRRRGSRLAKKGLKEKFARFPDEFVAPWLLPKPSTPLTQPPTLGAQPSERLRNQDILAQKGQDVKGPIVSPFPASIIKPSGYHHVDSKLLAGKKTSQNIPATKAVHWAEPILKTELAPHLPPKQIEHQAGPTFQTKLAAQKRPEHTPFKNRATTDHHRRSPWLESDTPFGKPMSAVRLFQPGLPEPQPDREESIFAPAWRNVQQPEIPHQHGGRIRPAGLAVRPLPAKWQGILSAVAVEKDEKHLATSVRGAELKKSDLATCYTPMAWLNDEIINGYLELIVRYLRRISGNLGRHEKPKYHAFNTFFFSNLRQKGYEGVVKWAPRAKIGGEDLLNVDTIFIPIHSRAHWTLMVVKPSARTIEHFDSLGSLSRAYVALAKEWLQGELGDLYVEEEWSVLPSTSPQQDNGSDCGVFLLTTAKAVAVGLEPLSYGAADIPLLRKKIVAELMHGGLEGEFDPAGESGESRL